MVDYFYTLLNVLVSKVSNKFYIKAVSLVVYLFGVIINNPKNYNELIEEHKEICKNVYICYSPLYQPILKYYSVLPVSISINFYLTVLSLFYQNSLFYILYYILNVVFNLNTRLFAHSQTCAC